MEGLQAIWTAPLNGKIPASNADLTPLYVLVGVFAASTLLIGAFFLNNISTAVVNTSDSIGEFSRSMDYLVKNPTTINFTEEEFIPYENETAEQKKMRFAERFADSRCFIPTGLKLTAKGKEAIQCPDWLI